MLLVEQEPGYKTMPAGTEIIYVINEDTGAMTLPKAKVIATLIVSKNKNLSNPIINTTFKATPNAHGKAIFNFTNILENAVKPTYSGMDSSIPSAISKMQGNAFNLMGNYHNIHNIDKFAYNDQSIVWFGVCFELEYLGGNTWADPTSVGVVGLAPFYACGSNALVFNGVTDDQDILTYPDITAPSFGYNLIDFIIRKEADSRLGKFISNAPTTQKATINDYGTFAFFNDMKESQTSFTVSDTGTYDTIAKIEVQPRKADNTAIGSLITLTNQQINGGYSKNGNDIPNANRTEVNMIFVGLFPANLRGWSSDFQSAVTDPEFSYYSIDCKADDDNTIGEQYRIEIIKECLYPPIRIAWLNKWGAWDYYTFTKKSTRQLKTKRKKYTKLNGTWNDQFYNINASKGGEKNYEITTHEVIKVNSDYMTEAEGQWLEELFNAQEMYIINPYFTLSSGNVVNKFATPVNLTDSSYKKKTQLNDKLIQYSLSFKTAMTRKSQRP